MNQQRGFLLLAITLSGLLGLYILLPFLEYVLVAILLAYVLQPLYGRLVPRIGPRLSAIVAIVFGFGAIVLPFVYVLFSLVRDLNAIAMGENGLAIGFVGLFVGPIALGILGATLATFKNDYHRL
jgi:predicted PurR-regulated permease PerM